MTHLERQVAVAQRRLWLNRWLHQFGWLLLFATGGWTLTRLADRLFVLGLPMQWFALGGFGIAFIGSLVWLALTRERRHRAAAALDEAVGLRERISTSLAFATDDDGFARAVRHDADRAVAGLSARKFIPVRWANSLSLSSVLLLVALLSLLLPEIDILGRKEARARREAQAAAVRQLQVALARPTEVIRRVAEKNPDLVKMDDLRNLDDPARLVRHDDAGTTRREAIKKLDKLRDALKKQTEGERFRALNETRNRLKNLGEAADPKGAAGKLLNALAQGDFQQAKEQVKKMQEELAKRQREGKIDPQKSEEMRKQLQDLADKLQQAAQDKQSEQELKNAGLSAAEAKRTLEALAKKDPEQLKKLAEELAQRLKDKGITKEQMEQMLEKMRQRQKACQQCNQMGQQMSKAAQKLGQGDQQGAQQELEMAEQSLSDLEQMEQQLNELESQLSELNQARDELTEEEGEQNDGQCKQCDGSGFRKDGSPCPDCQGSGQCMGAGRAAGERPRDKDAKGEFVDRKAKIKTTKGGRVIGQQFVKGESIKGQSNAELIDAAEAAELDATNALDRDRVPLRYKAGVKRYFDRLADDMVADAKEKPREPADSKGEQP